MRRRIFLSILLLILFVGVFVIYNRIQFLEQANIVPLDVSLISVEGNTVELSSRLGESKSIIAFISPDCGHCSDQIKELLSFSSEQQSSVSFTFISDFPLSELKQFSEQFSYTRSTIFLCDETGDLFRRMNISAYPTILLYNSNSQHIHTIKGESKPEYIFNLFNDH